MDEVTQSYSCYKARFSTPTTKLLLLVRRHDNQNDHKRRRNSNTVVWCGGEDNLAPNVADAVRGLRCALLPCTHHTAAAATGVFTPACFRLRGLVHCTIFIVVLLICLSCTLVRLRLGDPFRAAASALLLRR
jgi:hypothetical protein